MTRADYNEWAAGVQFANDLMHHSTKNGLGASPHEVTEHDKEAAALLQKARDAHDDLTNYLKSI